MLFIGAKDLGSCAFTQLRGSFGVPLSGTPQDDRVRRFFYAGPIVNASSSHILPARKPSAGNHVRLRALSAKEGGWGAEVARGQTPRLNKRLRDLYGFEGCHLPDPAGHSLLARDDDAKGAFLTVERMAVGAIGEKRDSVGE